VLAVGHTEYRLYAVASVDPDLVNQLADERLLHAGWPGPDDLADTTP
jgi:hypothetical protein